LSLSSPKYYLSSGGRSRSRHQPRCVIRQVFLAEQPSRVFSAVEQIAAALAFLRTEDAAATTGAALPVDGG